MAQTMKTHKVKKHETIYGIARSYGISESQLRSANPGMESADYVLKSGKKINIPVAQPAATSQPATDARDQTDDIRLRSIRMGVMLPLHDQNGDGRRMVEYYRGLLMACDSLKHEGISVDIYAWNTPEGTDLANTLEKPEAARCDIIFGPLYSSQMEQLSAFCRDNGTMMVIPFSIRAPQLNYNRHIFQVYQSPDGMNETISQRFADWFKDCHPIIVDCNDPNSTKGAFTTALRKELEYRNIRYSEWLALADSHRINFHRYDTYIPSPWMPGLSPYVALQLTQKYRSFFKHAMINFTPPLAMTGFDHAFFFLRGLHKYGRSFSGEAGVFGYQPVQTPLKFERVSPTGGYQNKAFMFIHYKTDGQTETISY